MPPGSIDLFGNVTPLQTWQQEYNEYMRSPAWKNKREVALKSADNKCQKCNHTKHSRRLNVHHITYEHFKNEPPEDLKVVCTLCHKIEDWKRAMETRRRNDEKLQDARFEGWARKVYGDNWMIGRDEADIYYQFEDWIYKNDYY